MDLFGEMRNMREEKVTINLLNWLESQGWSIICYDFPQSGTGLMIHPNSNVKHSEKNKDAIIPDIIAVKGTNAAYFENKDRFAKSDFDKLMEIKLTGNYSEGLTSLMKNDKIVKISYGIGIPSIMKEIQKSIEYLRDIDFLVSTDNDGQIIVHIDSNGIFK